MAYRIGDDGYLYDQTGRKLPRSEAAIVISQLQAVQGEPNHIYLVSDRNKRMLKPGHTNNLQKRLGQHALDIGQSCDLLFHLTVADKKQAISVEMQIHDLLRKLGRGPIFKQEWFKWRTHDAWLLQHLMMTVPIVALQQTFTALAASYPGYVQMYRSAPEYVSEEVRYLFGGVVHHHLTEEFAGVVIEPAVADDDTEGVAAVGA